MNKQITWALALASTLAVSVSATAEPFTNRGANYSITAPQGSFTASVPAVAGIQSFNNRGENFIATAPAGSLAPRVPVFVQSEGFNRRDPYSKGRTWSEQYASGGWNH
jgi:hypothetical protein